MDFVPNLMLASSAPVAPAIAPGKASAPIASAFTAMLSALAGPTTAGTVVPGLASTDAAGPHLSTENLKGGNDKNEKAGKNVLVTASKSRAAARPPMEKAADNSQNQGQELVIPIPVLGVAAPTPPAGIPKLSPEITEPRT